MTGGNAEDWRESAPQILATAYSFVAICTVSVGLRLFIRKFTRVGIKADDWFLLVGYILLMLTFALLIKGQLIAMHLESDTDPKVVDFLKYAYIFAPSYFPAIATIRISIILFYRRIFRDNRFNITSIILIVANVLWGIPTFIVEILTCDPPSSFWLDPLNAQVNCIYYGTFYIISFSIEILLDILILLLPIPEVRRLQISTSKKVMILGIFALGSFSVVTGIIRNIESYKAGAFMVDLSNDAFWSSLHMGTAVVSACLPTYKPLIRVTLERLSKASSYVYSGGSQSRSSGKGSGHDSRKGSSVVKETGYSVSGGRDWSRLDSKASNESDTYLMDLPPTPRVPASAVTHHKWNSSHAV